MNKTGEYITEKESMLQLIRDNYSGLLGSELETVELQFCIERAIYWYCNDNYCGQCDVLYSILSMSEYTPSMLENDIHHGDDFYSELFYELLTEERKGK